MTLKQDLSGKHSLSVIVPIYDEIGNIRTAYLALREVLDACADVGVYELLFVDDGSTDASWNECLSVAKSDSRVRCLKLAGHFGQHAALCAGLEAARGEILLTCDADLQVAPQDLPALWRKLGDGFDLVRAWRRGRSHRSWLRRCLSHLATRLLSLLLQRKHHDLTSPYAALRPQLARSLLKSGLRRQFLGITAVQLASSVAELPVRHRPRRWGTSRYSWRALIRLGMVLLATCFPALPRRLAQGAAAVGGFALAVSSTAQLLNFSKTNGFWMFLTGGASALVILGAGMWLRRKRAALLRAEESAMYKVVARYPPTCPPT